MMYAILNRERIEARSKLSATCPICNSKVIAKCGNIKVRHWSHESINECDDWYESETLWHRNWKTLFPEISREVKIGKHRADIFYKDKVIELQHSTILDSVIIERETFYSKHSKEMIWIIDASGFKENIELRKSPKNDFYTYRWRHPRKSLWSIKKRLFFDFRDGTMLYMKKVYPNVPCGGYGYIWTKEAFLKWVNQ